MTVRALTLSQAQERCARGELDLAAQDLDALSRAFASGETLDATIWINDRSPTPRVSLIAQHQAGNWGSVFFPSGDLPADRAIEFLTAARDWLFAFEGLKTICALSPRERLPETQALRSAGFVHLTEIAQLGRSISPTDPLLQSAGHPLSVRGTADWDEGQTLLRRTQIGSLDVPELGDHFPLEHLRGGGNALENSLRVYEHAGTVVGLGLGHADNETWRLDYLGVVPELRSRGFGRSILIGELACAVAAERGEIEVDVDVRNHGAVAIYEKSGFREAGRRDLWIARRGRQLSTRWAHADPHREEFRMSNVVDSDEKTA